MNGYDVYALALVIPALIGGGILTFCIFRDVAKAEEAAKKAEKMTLAKFKVGDKVRQIKVAHFPEQRCYLGRVGEVKELRYNHNMARYGMGDEILVDFDGSGSLWIEREEYLEKIV